MDEDQAIIPHMNAMDVPFHMHYGGLIWSKGLQSDRGNMVVRGDRGYWGDIFDRG